jgi:GNAT superfamily N-acetyltransferase
MVDDSTPFVLRDGRELVLRRIHPDDSAGLIALHLRLSSETQRMRFFVRFPRLSPAFAHQLTNVDFIGRAAFVACDRTGKDIHAVGRYERVAPATAEIAFVVEDPFQSQGLGPELFGQLVTVARQNGIEEFMAEVLLENQRMISLLREAGYPCETSIDGTVETFRLDIRQAPAPAASDDTLSRPPSGQG